MDARNGYYIPSASFGTININYVRLSGLSLDAACRRGKEVMNILKLLQKSL